MTNRKIFQCFLLLTLSLALSQSLIAQTIDTIEVWIDTAKVKQMQYVLVSDETDFAKTQLKPASYPVAIVPQLTLKQILKVNKERVLLSRDIDRHIALLERKDALSDLEIKHLNDYIATQQKHINDCESANKQLNNNINSLNGQLSQAIKLSETNIKHERFKKIGVGVVAGLAGFALGVLLNQ